LSVSSGSSSTTTVPSPTHHAELAGSPPNQKTWLTAIAPAYLGVFIWAPFYDQLWVSDLARFHLGWLLASAAGAALLCHVFFYAGLADWGFRTRLPLETLAASTFGASGARWLTSLLLGSAGIVICAIAIGFGVDSTLLGLLSCGLVDSADLGRWTLGPLTVESPVFLGTALFWTFILCMAFVLQLIGVVAALMRVYTPVALLVVTIIAVGTSPFFRSDSLDPARLASSVAARAGGPETGPSALQLICGYFALAGLAAADRGGAVKSRRDVVLGGATGIVLAGAWLAAAALFVVASAVARAGESSGVIAFGPDLVQPLSFRWAVLNAVGGRIGGTILILLGLAALAPGCYACWVYAHKLATLWPRLNQPVWVWVGGLIAFGLAATSCASRTAAIFCIMGDTFGPLIGAMLGDRFGVRGGWAGPRGAFNPAGLIAWATGSVLALSLDLTLWRQPTLAGWLPPTSLLGLVFAGLAYRLLWAIGQEPRSDDLRAANEN
jgi:cytosine permease